MSNNETKRQHYIPRMLLKRFCDADGFIYVGDRNTRYVVRQNLSNAFVKNHQYTRYSYEDDSRSMEYESRLGEIESAAAPVVENVVSSLSANKLPDLTDVARLALKRFVFSLARRTRESQSRVAAMNDDEEAFYQAACRLAEEQNHPQLPSREVLLFDELMPMLAEKVMHNVHAGFAAGDDTAIAAKEPEFCKETGFHFGTLRDSGSELVIGSHGITLHDAEAQDDKSLWFDGTVVPIAPHMLVNITGFPEKDYLSVLGAGTDAVVHSINQATVRLSRWIGGRSEAVIRSLLDETARGSGPSTCGCRKLCRGWSGGISVLIDESVTAGRSHDLEVSIWWVGGDGWSLVE